MHSSDPQAHPHTSVERRQQPFDPINESLSETDILNGEKALFQIAFSQIPYIGRMLSRLVGFVWPAGDQSERVWAMMKDNVQALINQSIEQATWNRIVAQLHGAQNVVDEYTRAVEGNVSPVPLREKYNAASAVFDALIPTFQENPNQFLLLPLFCQAASLHLSLLMDGAKHGVDRLAMQPGDQTYERSKINRLVRRYREYVGTTYANYMVHRTAGIPTLGTGRYYPRTFSEWQAIRIHYRKSCLDLALSWVSFMFVSIMDTSYVGDRCIADYNIPITPHFIIMTTAQGTLDTGVSLGEANVPYGRFFYNGELAIIAQVETAGDGRVKRFGCDNRAFSINRPDAVGCQYNWHYGFNPTSSAGNNPPYGFSRVVARDNPVTSVSVNAGDVPSQISFRCRDNSLLGYSNGDPNVPISNPSNWGYGGDTALVWMNASTSGFYQSLGCTVGATIPLSGYLNILAGKCVKPNRETAHFIGDATFWSGKLCVKNVETEGFSHSGSTTSYHYGSRTYLGVMGDTIESYQEFGDLASTDNSVSTRAGVTLDTSGRSVKFVHRSNSRALAAEMVDSAPVLYPELFRMEVGGCDTDQWVMMGTDDGMYRLLSKHSHRALTLAGYSSETAACILEDLEQDDPRQLWRLESDGHGAFRILSGDGAWTLDLDDSPAVVRPARSPEEDGYPWLLNASDAIHGEEIEKLNLAGMAARLARN